MSWDRLTRVTHTVLICRVIIHLRSASRADTEPSTHNRAAASTGLKFRRPPSEQAEDEQFGEVDNGIDEVNEVGEVGEVDWEPEAGTSTAFAYDQPEP